MKVIPGLLTGLLIYIGIAIAEETVWLSEGDNGREVHLYFFWSPSCPHCQEARPVIEKMARDNAWLILHSGDVINNRENLRTYQVMSAKQGEEARSVPAFFVCGRMFVGWDMAEGIGQTVLNTALDCRDKGMSAMTDIETELPQWVRDNDYSLPLFTLIIAGLDAFNPCAFFVLLFLLSLLVNARSRKRMLLVGATFVFVSGALYFLFMAAWLNLFLMLGTLGWINLIAGLLALTIGLFGIKDFLSALRGPSLSISTAARSKLYSRIRGLISVESMPMLLLGTATLAIAANSYELLCTAGFPMVYTRVLTMHQLVGTEYYLYLLFYNIIYVIPLLLIVVGFVVTLGGRKLTINEGRLLKLLSGTMMAGLGMVLLLKPELLNNLLTGVGLLALALTVTLFARGLLREQ